MKIERLLGEFQVRVLIEDGASVDSFEEEIEQMKSTISQLEWEGLSYHEGVRIEVIDGH